MATRVDFLIGCTASGKGAVGLEVARRLGAEILSLDSMKVYRRMDIGTAKPSPERRAAVPHHLLDVVEPSESFSVARFVALAGAAIDDITGRRKRVLAVGGTALYLKGLIEGLFEGPSADQEIRRELRARADREGNEALHAELAAVDPESAARIHRNDLRRLERALEVYRLTGTPISALQTQWDRERTKYDCHVVGLRRDKDDQNRRSNARVQRMIEAGFVDEVRNLLAEPVPMGDQARQALGYAEIIDHLQSNVPLDDAIEAIKIHTRQFAKHQRTWFRRFRQTRWIDLTEHDAIESTAQRVCEVLA
jgi:tRNA dimethylallyltransferase